jgi:hypothetical protein
MTTLMMKKTIMTFAAAATLAFAASAFAAGGGGGGGGSNSGGGNSSSDGGGNDGGREPTRTTRTCKNGQVWIKKRNRCGDVQKSGLNDTELYEAAREFAYAGQYGNALVVLKVAKNQDDPRILNYYGFTNRKLGNVDVAMDYYKRAIAADANYLLARSYMGQGLVQQGDLEGARAQLVEIRDRGGKDTYAYKALYEALKNGSTY